MIETFMQILSKIAGSVVGLLPASPFRQYIDMFSDLPYLGYLNWFIPVGICVKIGSAWLVAISVFYLYSIVLRWIKVTGG